jgi:ABC-type phosphate transport system auxiliary subunit
LSPQALKREKVAKSYQVIFEFISNDVKVDLDLAHEMLRNRLLKTDWFDDDLFNQVLKLSAILNDETERGQLRELRLQENPVIWQIVDLMDRAKRAGKKVGIWPVNDSDGGDFWKKTFVTNSKQH